MAATAARPRQSSAVTEKLPRERSLKHKLQPWTRLNKLGRTWPMDSWPMAPIVSSKEYALSMTESRGMGGDRFMRPASEK
jgi:hypothetical protein